MYITLREIEKREGREALTATDDSDDEYSDGRSCGGGRRIAGVPTEKIGLPWRGSEALALTEKGQLMVEEEAWAGALLKHQIKINNKNFQNPKVLNQWPSSS